MILKISIESDMYKDRPNLKWMFFDGVDVGLIEKDYRFEGDQSISRHDYRYSRPTSGPEADYYYHAYIDKGDREVLDVLFTEGYLLNNEGRTIERFA